MSSEGTPPSAKNAFDEIAATIKITGGLTLSQLSALSGLETSTIQNWVKRGWVQSPVSRRYGEEGVARTLIIAKLRSAMQLSSIVELMSYVNGKLDDRSDDAIPDYMLYNKLCYITDSLKELTSFGKENVENAVNDAISDYVEPFPGGREKLFNALTVMTLAFISAEFKNRADSLFSKIIKE